MKVIAIVSLLLLSGCITTSGKVDCLAAEGIKAAARATIEAVEEACPVGIY
jgi:hypothetical protein